LGKNKCCVIYRCKNTFFHTWPSTFLWPKWIPNVHI